MDFSDIAVYTQYVFNRILKWETTEAWGFALNLPNPKWFSENPSLFPPTETVNQTAVCSPGPLCLQHRIRTRCLRHSDRGVTATCKQEKKWCRVFSSAWVKVENTQHRMVKTQNGQYFIMFVMFIMFIVSWPRSRISKHAGFEACPQITDP